MSTTWERFVEKLREMNDINSAYALFEWDQASFMPAKGGDARARAVGTMARFIHERVTDPELGDLIAELEGDASLDPIQSASVRILKRERDKATKVPAKLVTELKESEMRGYQAWADARPESDFRKFQPFMEATVRLKKEEADHLGWTNERYDACLDYFEPGMTARELEALFTNLTEGLQPLAAAILDAAGPPPKFLSDNYEVNKQIDFCNALVDRLGFDREGGRLDFSPHPFTIRIAHGDIRQTLRVEEDDLMMSIYAAIHETGHALYDQGSPDAMAGLPVADAPSMGMHESQSRLWENHVGRGRAFSEHLLPGLKDLFEKQLGNTDPDEFYRGINHPERSLIRIKADEVTYNLHIALRFELELALFRDELQVADLPDAWDAAMEKHLGIRPESHSDGVLQDMHWADGYFGYFPTYTLGTLYAAAFYDKMIADIGDVDDELRKGDSSRVLGWLRENVHQHAYLYPAKELAHNILGTDLTAQPFLDHIGSKYSEIYSLSI
ncbi:MAG: carboxypeptidase Taq [Actinomycetota bacterium]|jgi:carboxypeptidase Taq|nr:carboxypeptidase Taq [Actinomycetota bacterium]